MLVNSVHQNEYISLLILENIQVYRTNKRTELEILTK
jgi:hypothetical protein